MTSTLVYDGDCAFCTTSARQVLRIGLAVDSVIAWQHADLASLGLTAEQCGEAVQLVEDGRVTSGHEAFGRLLLGSSWRWRGLGRLLLTPPISWLAAAAYRWVARNRHRLPGGTPACAVPPAPSAVPAVAPAPPAPPETPLAPPATPPVSAAPDSGQGGGDH